MRVGVTGANGHLGRAVAQRIAAGGPDVVELSSSPTGAQRPFRLGEPLAPGTLDDVDVVIHVGWDQAAADQGRNVAGSQQLIEAAQRVVFVSSLAAYPGTRSPYGAAKTAVEGAVARAGGTSVRPGLIFGPSVGGMFGRLRDQVRQRPVVPVIHSPGRLQLVHVSDVAALLVELALRPREDPEPVAVAHPAAHSLGHVVRTIARGLDRRVLTVPVPWQAVYGGLRLVERVRTGLPFGADNVISLARAPQARIAAEIAARCRPFDERTLAQP